MDAEERGRLSDLLRRRVANACDNEVVRVEELEAWAEMAAAAEAREARLRAAIATASSALWNLGEALAAVDASAPLSEDSR